MNEEPRYIATNLGKSLESKGLKQSWIARQLGVSKSLMSKVVSGDRSVDQMTAEKIAALVGVPLFLLFELRQRSKTESEMEKVPA